MANDNGIGSGGLLLAFVAGAMTGAAVALLYAPAPGTETRDYLDRRTREARERAAEAVRQGRQAAEEAARQGRDVINRQRDQVTTAFERAREQYQQKTGGTEGQET